MAVHGFSDPGFSGLLSLSDTNSFYRKALNVVVTFGLLTLPPQPVSITTSVGGHILTYMKGFSCHPSTSFIKNVEVFNRGHLKYGPAETEADDKMLADTVGMRHTLPV